MTALGISHTLLIAAQPFSARLSAQRVAAAIARGVHEAGLPAPDLCPFDGHERTAGGRKASDASAILAGCDFDDRMKAARAVVIAVARLDERTLLGSLAFEIATRARQSGVPAYAVTAADAIARFDARILDLQEVVQARDESSLQAAGRRLAAIA